MTKTKDQRNNNCCKLCCWIIILALLAGAVSVVVLIGSKLGKRVQVRINFSFLADVIDTKPVKQVKESRKLDAEIVMEDRQTLIEVSDDEAPHVLTNDPTFFTSLKNKEVIKEDRGKIVFC